MSLVLTLACVWVLAATATAMLPKRWQTWAGAVLLAVAAVLLVWIFRVHAPWVGLLCSAAVVSVYRKPIGALARLAKTRSRA